MLFEGWCLKAMPEDDIALSAPVNALERDEDPDGVWRRHCNDALRRDYPALWSRIDALWFLQPPGFDIVRTWRWEQEQALLRNMISRERRFKVDEDIVSEGSRPAGKILSDGM